MSWLLSNLFDLPGFQADSNSSDSLIFDLTQLRHALNAGHVARILSALKPFLGKGSGLTPSGDDLVMGLLLSLNRWGILLRPDLDVQALNQAILLLAYQRTTRLAANLIECATLGQANEHILIPLDGILTGEPDIPTCVSLLLDWGNSSGCDAFVGMSLAILTWGK